MSDFAQRRYQTFQASHILPPSLSLTPLPEASHGIPLVCEESWESLELERLNLEIPSLGGCILVAFASSSHNAMRRMRVERGTPDFLDLLSHS
ncbi:hypothetical protein A9K55_000537 [Cordyceps militaris]|uniref:Uncharacterized protein n=1 Tax=Cordyceps militaris TaxID=73501 RepID=A0A2H4STG6_CORMI|nr:hypothetical protein A9K55_000537 [Cordyceps militaris]